MVARTLPDVTSYVHCLSCFRTSIDDSCLRNRNHSQGEMSKNLELKESFSLTRLNLSRGKSGNSFRLFSEWFEDSAEAILSRLHFRDVSSDRNMRLTTHLHVLPNIKIRLSAPPFPPYLFVAKFLIKNRKKITSLLRLDLAYPFSSVYYITWRTSHLSSNHLADQQDWKFVEYLIIIDVVNQLLTQFRDTHQNLRYRVHKTRPLVLGPEPFKLPPLRTKFSCAFDVSFTSYPGLPSALCPWDTST